MYGSINDFYDKLDLKYPEIAICIERIDRLDPGNPKFIIPVLTPNLNTNSEFSKSIFQNDSNIRNGDISPEIANITMNNYITIPLPKELCGNYDTTFLQCARMLVDVDLDCVTSNNGEYHNCNGTLNKEFQTLYNVLTSKSRYIEKGSKWIVVFVGGDITKPRIIAPYDHLS